MQWAWLGSSLTSRHDHAQCASVLVVEDEICIHDVLVDLFDVEGTLVKSAASLESAKALLASRAFDLIVTDIRLGGRRVGGLQVMAAAGVLSPDATVIALTAFPDVGATHFLEKPVSLERIAELAAGAGVPTAMRSAKLEAVPKK